MPPLLLLFISCYACNNSGAFQTEKLQALPRGAHNLKVDKKRDVKERGSTEKSRGQDGNQPYLSNQMWFECIVAKLYKLFSNYCSYFPFCFN